MSGQTNGGVFNPRNLSLYAYTYSNPVNMSDPDGNAAFAIALAPEAAVLIESGIVALGATLAGMLGIEAINNNNGGIIGGGFQAGNVNMDNHTTLPAYDGELGSFSAFPSSENEINIDGFDTDGPSGASASIFPTSNDNGVKVYNSGESSSRAKRRESMRQAGIPTSQQPISQSKNKSGREYTYRVPQSGSGGKLKSVQEQTLDRSHPGVHHWEAGDIKVRDGDVQYNNYGRPKLENTKSKVE